MTATTPDTDLLQAAGDEVLEHLRSLLRLDTRNPPGNEFLAANYLRDTLARDGIDSEVVGPSADRASIIARLRENTAQSIETSSLHLDLISDLKRINSHICGVAYPILESAGALTATRIRQSQFAALGTADDAAR